MAKDVAVMDPDDDENRPRHYRVNKEGAQRMSEREETLMDKVMRKRKELDEKRNQFWQPAQGINRVRVMPSWKGPNEEFYVEIPTHYEVGPDRKTVPCLQFWDQPCPVERLIEQLSASNVAADQNLATKLTPRTRILVNVGIPNEPDGAIKVWALSESLFHEILGYFADPDYGDFTHPRTGFDLIFTRKGEKLATRYTNLHLARHTTPVKIDDWRKRLVKLDQFIKPIERKKIRAILAGEDTE